MQQASTFFSKEEVAQIEAAVAEAESKTSAEIVPVVATASGRYDRPEDIVGVWFGAIAAAAAWFIFRGVPAPESGWGFQWGTLELPVILVALVLGFIVGAAVGSASGTLRRLFTPRSQMRDEVALRARQVFFDSRVHRTEGGTGLLVYLSIYERMAAVLADDAILQKLGQGALDELCAALTQGMQNGAKAESVCRVIKDAGQALGKVLPRADDDVNELEDTLVVLDE